MQYRDKLLELIFADDKEALFNWMHSFPHLDQVEVLKEYAVVMKELFEAMEVEFPQEIMEDLNTKTERYQESILDAELASLKYEIASKDRDKAIDDMYCRIDGYREHIKHCIAINTPDAEKLRSFAKAIIEYEKKRGLYNPLNWMGIE